jgi:hypothetical protein
MGSIKYYIRRKSDDRLVAIRYNGRQEAEQIVKYLNEVDEVNEYYYTQDV